MQANIIKSIFYYKNQQRGQKHSKKKQNPLNLFNNSTNP